MKRFFERHPESEELSEEDYVAPELLALKKRRKYKIILLCVLLVGGTLTFFLARPLGRIVKNWQASRIARQVGPLLERRDYKKAQSKIQDALALSPTNPEAILVAARFLTKAGAEQDAVKFWKKVEASKIASHNDEMLYATALLATGDTAGAQKHILLADSLSKREGPDDPALKLSLAIQLRNELDATRIATDMVDNMTTPAEQKLQAALFLISSANQQGKAQRAIESISEQKTEVGLAALTYLASQWAAKKADPNNNDIDATKGETLAQKIDANPKVDTKHQLFAVDLRIRANNEKKNELIGQAIQRFSKSDDDLEILSAWLYGKGEYERALLLLTDDVAVHRQTLFLQKLDTMAALGQWKKVRDTIQESRFALDRVTTELYLARCDTQLGNASVADQHWQAALDAALTDEKQLRKVADYAAKSGREEILRQAAQTIIQEDPQSRAGYVYLVQIYQITLDTKRLNEVLQKMAEAFPEDDAVANDLAYSDLLLERNSAQATQTAKMLYNNTPASLPHRMTLALADYRLANYEVGLGLLQRIEGDPGPLANRLATLKATLLWALDRKEEAAAAVDGVNTNSLFPEEQRLIAPVLKLLNQGV